MLVWPMKDPRTKAMQGRHSLDVRELIPARLRGSANTCIQLKTKQNKTETKQNKQKQNPSITLVLLLAWTNFLKYGVVPALINDTDSQCWRYSVGKWCLNTSSTAVR